MRLGQLPILALFFFIALPNAVSGPVETYESAIQLAKQQNPKAGVIFSSMSGNSAMPVVWRERAKAAASILALRGTQRSDAGYAPVPEPYQQLVSPLLVQEPEPESSWLIGAASVILPGAGHAWLGRWRDAMVGFILVVPMLVLTLWASARRMGPVTVFFAVISVWLWSGVVFSAISLHERSYQELHQQWWQQVWLSSGLPGRPW